MYVARYVVGMYRFLKKGEPGEPRRSRRTIHFYTSYIFTTKRRTTYAYAYYKKENHSLSMYVHAYGDHIEIIKKKSVELADQ